MTILCVASVILQKLIWKQHIYIFSQVQGDPTQHRPKCYHSLWGNSAWLAHSWNSRMAQESLQQGEWEDQDSTTSTSVRYTTNEVDTCYHSDWILVGSRIECEGCNNEVKTKFMILTQKKKTNCREFQIAGNFYTQITDNEDNGYKGTACPHRLFCYNTHNVTSYINCLPMEAAVGTREKFLYTQYVVISGAIIFNIPHNDCSNQCNV